jgi:hypothetical protein
MSETTVGAHVCNAYCAPPIHCGTIYADSDDLVAVRTQIRRDLALYGASIDVISIDRAGEAPPYSWVASRLSRLGSGQEPLDDTSRAYLVFYISRLGGNDS